MRSRSDILLVGQTPPPYHGQAVVTGMLYEHTWEDLKVEKIRMCFSDEISSVGKASIGKVFHLFSLIAKTWYIVFRKSPQALYYLPASPNLTPVLRDFIYLGAVRWMFPKTIFHYHAGGLDKFLESKPWLKKLTKWVYDGADVSIDVNVTSPGTGEYFLAKQNVVVMNGLDVQPMKMDREPGAFRIISVGMICEEKGALELVKTARLLKDQGLDCIWDVVGSWESDLFKTEMLKLIDELDVVDNIQFLGVKKGSDKWSAYAGADAFVFLSHHPTETFGLVLIEAMGMGLPIITTKWRGIPHVVGNSEAALLCDVKSPEQFSIALRKLITDPERCAQMSENAVSYYNSHYTRKVFVSNMEAAFKLSR